MRLVLRVHPPCVAAWEFECTKPGSDQKKGSALLAGTARAYRLTREGFRPAGSMRVRGEQRDLHGNAPDTSSVVMLVIDVINDFNFKEGAQVLADARPVAERIQRLKRRTRRAGIPTVYVNDNFGRWRSDFRALISHCLSSAALGRSVVRRLRPDRLDYFVLKPKHSAFYSTALELLLEHFQARTLILTGLLADSCILATAQDAYMRGYELVVPVDCVAARTTEDRRRTVALMRRTLHTETRTSTTLNLSAMIARAQKDR